MMPRLGEKYAVEIDVTSKPKAEYQTNTYFELDLPVAPAVMVGEEIVVEGADVSDHEVEACICRHLAAARTRETEKGDRKPPFQALRIESGRH